MLSSQEQTLDRSGEDLNIAFIEDSLSFTQDTKGQQEPSVFASANISFLSKDEHGLAEKSRQSFLHLHPYNDFSFSMIPKQQCSLDMAEEELFCDAKLIFSKIGELGKTEVDSQEESQKRKRKRFKK